MLHNHVRQLSTGTLDNIIQEYGDYAFENSKALLPQKEIEYLFPTFYRNVREVMQLYRIDPINFDKWVDVVAVCCYEERAKRINLKILKDREDRNRMKRNASC